MKKGLKVISLIICLFFLSGCINSDIYMSIDEFKSVDFKMSSSLDILGFMENMLKNEELAQSFKEEIANINCRNICEEEDTNCIDSCVSSEVLKIKEISKEDIKKYLDNNFGSDILSEENEDIEIYKKAGFNVDTKKDEENFKVTVDISKHFNNIDEITTDNDKEINITDFLKGNSKYLFIKNANGNYKCNLKVDSKGENLDYLTIDTYSLSNLFNYTYKVTLPVKAINNNANKISSDGKTLNWTLEPFKENNITYEFNLNNINKEKITKNTPLKIMAYALIGGGTFIGLVTIIIYSTTNKK